jgi:hypothetical protein
MADGWFLAYVTLKGLAKFRWEKNGFVKVK